MNNYTNLNDFLADLPALAEQFKDKLADQNALFLLDIAGRKIYVKLAEGNLSLLDECAEKPQATIAATEETLMDLLSGKLNPMAAMFTGKVSVSGSMGALSSLMTLLKG